MAFADQKSLTERSIGMTGAIILPAAMGAVIISGLAVKIIDKPIVTQPIDTFEIKDEIPPLPTPDPKPDQPVENPISQVVTPDPVIEIPTSNDLSDTISELPPLDPGITNVVLPSVVETGPAMPSITPVTASPRNNPGNWVTTSDYRTSWINREWTGTARFELEISASGRVTDCQITRSTGHRALDRATCQLIAERARFNPATNSQGDRVPSTYSNAISWELPD